GDSEFNRRELEALGFPETGVLPVVPDFAHLDGPPNDVVAREFDDERTNVLFVGRIIPNKRIENVIRFFAAYKARYNPRARLLLVGSYGGFERYLAMLQDLAARLHVGDVHFTGHVSDGELTAYYDVADVFLCASEHEGFCVPLVEAFYKRIPVLALARTAVPATLDGAGVLYDEPDPADVAALLDAVAGDAGLRERILEGQDAALDRLRARDFAGTLTGFVERVRRAPRRPAHRVAWDFWQQVDTAERLEQQRLFRPSLYKALPASARASGLGW
ncbi:MAG TPA: glycosyltransferase family 4 protein, partial [Vicinamibacterales bacterium]|nr:glycosyltransferase family 4 protein [Vicinamibacterales bacterium]